MAKFQALTDSTTSKRNLNKTLIQSICFLFRVELWQSIASLAVVFPQFGHTSNQLLSMYKISLLKVAMGTALSIKDIKTVWQIFANIMVFTM